MKYGPGLMLRNKVKKHLVFSVYVLGVIFVSLLPGGGGSFWHLDKIGHYLAYLGMAVLAFLTFKAGTPQILALLFAVVLGAALEWCQSFLPGRDMSLWDGIANTLGVISGVVLFHFRGQYITRYADRIIK